MKSNNPRAAAEGWYAKSFIHQRRMQIDSALICIDQAELLSRNTENFAFRLGVLNSKANTLLKANRYKDVYITLDEMTQHINDGGDSTHLWKVYRLQGIANKFQGNFEASIQAHVRSSRINTLSNTPELSNDYTNIAMCYVEMKQDSIALIWFSKAHQASKQHPSLRVKHRTKLNLARHYRKLNQFDSAVFHIEVLLQDSSIMREDQLFIAWDNLANLYIEKNDGVSARIYLDKMKNLGLDDSSPHYLKVDYLFLETIWHKAFGELEDALKFCDAGIQWSLEKNMINKQLPLLQKRAAIFEKMGDFSEATNAYKKYLHLKDSLLTHSNAEAIQRIVSEYELEEKERLFEREMQQQKKHWSYWTFILIIPILGGGAIYAFQSKKTINGEFVSETKDPLIKDKLPRFIQLQSKVHIEVSSIIYIKSDGHYLDYFIQGKEKPEIDRHTITKCFEMVKPYGFIRTHRSYIVNSEHIRGTYNTRIELKNNVVVPLSKSCRQTLIDEGHPIFVSE